jgi:glutamyl-tRNA reductase
MIYHKEVIFKDKDIHKDRESNSLLIFDLAEPSDVAQDALLLPGIKYYGLKQIEQQVNGNKAIRIVIEDESKRFLAYQKRYFRNKQTIKL